MKLNQLFFALMVVVTVSIGSCGSNTGKKQDTNDRQDIKNETLNEVVGKLINFEESGLYGRYYAVLVTKNSDTTYFNYETEENPENFYNLVEDNVKITYEKALRNSALDILSDNTSLLGEYGGLNYNGGKPKPEWKKIEGILSAESVTEGDLPDIVSITPQGGEKLEFEYFITPEMAEQNQKMVTVYYRIDEIKNIISIEKVNK